jgi:hypothetical protein
VRRNENAGMGINGRSVEALRRCGDGAVAVGRCLGGVIWILGRLGEERTQRRWKGLYGGGEENGENGRNSDLKAGHVRPKNEYVRTYISTFNRTPAGCMGVK